MSHKKIVKSGKYSTVKGTYFPLNKEKYKGEVDPKFKSSLEHRFMIVCDRNPAISSWSYERIVIPYVDESRGNTKHNYYMDFKIVMNTVKGPKTILVEVKSFKETIAPIKTDRKKQGTYKKEVDSWIRNSCKWAAARTAAKARGWEFRVLTEKNLVP